MCIRDSPCTVIEAGPCVVTQVKTVEKDGYAAVQLGFQDKKEKHKTKPLMGHFKRAGVTPKDEYKRQLIERGIVKTVKSAKKIVDRKEPVIWDILEHVRS